MSKSPEMEKALNSLSVELFGRKRTCGECVSCGKEVTMEDFRDELSRREYGISHFCQECQDTVFGV